MKKFLNFKFVLSVISSLVFTTAAFSILGCNKTFGYEKSVEQRRYCVEESRFK